MKFSILPNPQFLGKFHFLYSVARNLAHTCGKVILYGKLHFFVQWVLSTFTATFSLLNHLSTVLHSMWKPVIWSATQIQMPYLQIFKNSHVVHNFIQQWCKDLNGLIFVKTYKTVKKIVDQIPTTFHNHMILRPNPTSYVFSLNQYKC